MSKQYPKYLKASIVSTFFGVLTFGLSVSNLLKIYQIFIIVGLYFIWEAFLEPVILGEEEN